MTDDYTVTAECVTRFDTLDDTTEIIEPLLARGGTLQRSPRGRVALVFPISAENFTVALHTALAILYDGYGRGIIDALTSLHVELSHDR
ncbi:hypothetical protein ACWEKT_39645 [Nocardia takedensis]